MAVGGRAPVDILACAGSSEHPWKHRRGEHVHVCVHSLDTQRPVS